MLKEQNLAQRVRGPAMAGACGEGAWILFTCKGKSLEALGLGGAVI